MSLISEESWKPFQETWTKRIPLGIYSTKISLKGTRRKDYGCMIGLLQNARKKERLSI